MPGIAGLIPGSSLSGTTLASNSGGNNSDPSPDSSVYDTQSQQPSSSIAYYSTSNSFATNASTGDNIGHASDSFDPTSYSYTAVYDMRNTTDFVDSTTFDSGNHPHSTSIPTQLQHIQHRINGQTFASNTIVDFNKLDIEDNEREKVRNYAVAIAVEAHHKTLLKTRKQIVDSLSSSSHEVAAQLEFFRGLVSN